MQPRHLALVGPTASGKSALAFAAAEAFGDAEIVSLDSMQVYRSMDIGTAKPTVTERARVRHHLVDVAEPSEEWSVARTQRAAREAIASIEERGLRALLVGGTGLYVRAVVDGLEIPGEDANVRAELEAGTADADGLAAAWRELERLDPEGAARITTNNRRRIVRALEVVRVTGRPFSSFGPGLERYGPPAISIRLVGVWLPRAVVSSRIATRMATMCEQGFLDEVRRLAGGPLPLSRTAAEAIGYREFLAHLRPDGPSLDEASVAAAARTRAFARRQRVWFRRDPRIAWLAAAQNPEALLPALLATWGHPGAESVIVAGARHDVIG